MTNDEHNILVLKDQAGNYFVVGQEALEQGRVPAERTAEMEPHLGEAEVSGYMISKSFFQTIEWQMAVLTSLSGSTIGKTVGGIAGRGSR